MLLEGSFLVDIVLLDERLQIQKSGNPLSFVRVSSSHQVSMSWCNCSYWSEVSAGAHMGVYCHKTEVTSWTSMGINTMISSTKISLYYAYTNKISSSIQMIKTYQDHLSTYPLPQKRFQKRVFLKTHRLRILKAWMQHSAGKRWHWRNRQKPCPGRPLQGGPEIPGWFSLWTLRFFFLVGRGSLCTKNFRVISTNYGIKQNNNNPPSKKKSYRGPFIPQVFGCYLPILGCFLSHLLCVGIFFLGPTTQHVARACFDLIRHQGFHYLKLKSRWATIHLLHVWVDQLPFLRYNRGWSSTQ